MEGRKSAELLLAWSVATFETVAAVLTLIILAFIAGVLGDALESSNTVFGISLFAVLWATTFYCTLRAIREVAIGEDGGYSLNRLLARAMWWGANNAGYFLGCLIAFGIVFSLAASVYLLDPAIFLITLFFSFFVALIGGAIAWAIGGFVGLFFGCIISVILWMARNCLIVRKGRMLPHATPR